jgi:hypothetical protein
MAPAGSVVDCNIEPAQLLDGSGDHLLHPCRVGDIRRDGHRTATRVRDLRGHPLERFRVAGSEHDGGPGAGHRSCDLGADPAACTGHNRPAARERPFHLSHIELRTSACRRADGDREEPTGTPSTAKA